MTPDARLSELLNALCNGTLDEAAGRELDQRLAADPAARARYLEWMTTEGALHRTCLWPTSTAQEPVVNDAPPCEMAPTVNHRAARQWLSIGVLAASLVGVALLSSLVTQYVATGHRLADRGDVVTTPSETSVARITSTLNCRWAEPRRGAGYGAELHAGDQLKLLAGFAEVTFESGVRIILEGPATLDVQDSTEAVLRDGRLAASIPGDAQQPVLRVGRFTAFEPGSEFGLKANSAGGGEVHVFSGQVSATLLDDGGKTLEAVRLETSEGAIVTSTARSMTKVAADGDLFVRSLNPTAGPHDGLYLVESFDYLDGPLAQQNGGFGWAGPWEDIETNSGSGFDEATNRVAPRSLEVEGMIATGGHAIQTAQRDRVRRAVSTSIRGVFDAAGLVENRDGHRLVGRDGRTVYVAFLQRVDKLDDVFYGFELHRGDGNGNRVLCVGNGAEGAGYGVTSNYNQYGRDNYPSLGNENTDTNLIVVRIDFGADDHDVATIWRNPRSLADEEASVVTATMEGNFGFDRISLGNFDGAKVHEIDEIRVGTSYRAVLGQRDLFRSDLAGRFAAGQLKQAH